MQRDEPPQALSAGAPAPTATPESSGLSPFTAMEWVALLGLRRRYQVGHDLWSDHELASLRFLRWLRDAGRLDS